MLLALVLTAVWGAAAKDGNASFEGKWVLDAQASECPAALPEGLTQQIKNKGGKLTVESFWREPKGGVAPLVLLGIMATRLELTPDGSDTTNQVGPFAQVSKTTVEGNRVTTQWTANEASGEVVTGQWVRTLSEDGKRQTLEIQTAQPGKGQQSARLVFQRK
jgi:hypothetical protein